MDITSWVGGVILFSSKTDKVPRTPNIQKTDKTT